MLCDYFGSLLAHGTFIRQYTVGEFWMYSHYQRRKMLTAMRVRKVFNWSADRQYIHYLDNKVDFNKYFDNLVTRGWLYLKDSNCEEFESFMRKYKTVIIKPINANQGKGVRFLNIENADVKMDSLFDSLREEDVMIEEVVVQHPRMTFGNSSVNTIRVYTILDKNNEAHLLKVILRAGIGDSVVDNYCAGGCIYEVDCENGIIISKGKRYIGTTHIKHPGTDITMLGYQLPHWDKIVETVLAGAKQLPQIRIIAWDVAVTNDGVEIIEGNQRIDYELLEFLGTNGYYEKIRPFME